MMTVTVMWSCLQKWVGAKCHFFKFVCVVFLFVCFVYFNNASTLSWKHFPALLIIRRSKTIEMALYHDFIGPSKAQWVWLVQLSADKCWWPRVKMLRFHWLQHPCDLLSFNMSENEVSERSRIESKDHKLAQTDVNARVCNQLAIIYKYHCTYLISRSDQTSCMYGVNTGLLQPICTRCVLSFCQFRFLHFNVQTQFFVLANIETFQYELCG